MSVSVTVNIKFGEWKRYLMRLPTKISVMQNNIIKSILTSGRNTARKHAPSRTGRLRNAIEARVESGVSTTLGGAAIPESTVVIYIDDSLAPYGQYVIEGTSPSPGRYVPAIGRRLTTGTRIVQKRLLTGLDIGYHPGIKANPFMMRAFEEYWTEFENKCSREFKVALSK